MKSADLLPNARNWRTHPDAQSQALRDILGEVGQVQGLVAYHSERAGGALVLIDGHLRLKEADEWDVSITDLTDSEADKLLLTLDPIAAMAGADAQALDTLLRDVQTGSAALQELLASMAVSADLLPPEPVLESLPGNGDTSPAPDQSSDLQAQFNVLVVCASEEEQADLLERLTAEGLQCRSLLS